MPLQHTLLGLLERGPRHGYRLRQDAKRYSWIYPMTHASIYPALHDLEEKGFVSHHSEVHNGRGRKVYAITEAGRRELRKWLASPTRSAPSFRDQVVLKIAMQTNGSVDGSREWIEEALEAVREDLERHGRQIQGHPDEAPFAGLALEYGAELLRLRMRFLQDVLERSTPEAQARSAVG
jgi:DNA-binding PadR family transcriptional regulator